MAIIATVLIKTFGLILANQDGFLEGIHPPFFKKLDSLTGRDNDEYGQQNRCPTIRQIEAIPAQSATILEAA
jgi:hypothetical protein